jgi:hypothetical protein
VAEQLTNHLKRGATTNKKRRERMAQVMDTHIWQICFALNPYPKPTNFFDGLVQNIS